MSPTLQLPVRSFLSLLFAVLLGVSVAGCVVIPLGLPDPGWEDRLAEDLAAVEVGRATKSEIVDRLGEPETLLDEGPYSIYLVRSGGVFIYVLYTVPGIYGFDVVGRVLVESDGKGVVERLVAEVDADSGKRRVEVPPMKIQDSTGMSPAPLPKKTLFRVESGFWTAAAGYASVAVSRDGALIATSYARGEALIENIETGQRSRFKIQQGGDWNWVNPLAFSTDGKRLYAVARTVRILGVPSGKQIGLFSGHGDESFWRYRGATALAVAPDGASVATGGAEGEVKLWDAATTDEKLAFKAHDDWVSSVAFSPDGSLLATASKADGSVRLWDTTNGSEHTRIPRKGPADTVAFSPSGDRLAIASPHHVEVWRVVPRRRAGQGRPEPVVEGPIEMFIPPVVDPAFSEPTFFGKRPAYRGLAVSFSPDSRMLAACFGGASIWDLDTSRQLWRMVPGGPSTDDRPSGSGRIYDCAFTPDGRYLATAGDDGVHLWDLSSLGESFAGLRGHETE